MTQPTLNQHTFAALAVGDSGAFLPLDDATSDIQAQYAVTGLVDAAGTRRIARVVTLPAGFRLFKLTHYNTLRDTLSPWWSSAEPFQENDLGAKQAFETALLNGVSLREFVRFISAVSLDWNLLDYYVEIELKQPVAAYWGQFNPQHAIQKQGGTIDGVETHEQPAPGGDDTMVHYDSAEDPNSQVYLPDWLGGFGAWQLYLPDFVKSAIDSAKVVTLQATDDQGLAQHFGIPQQRVEELLQQRQVWKDGVGEG